MRNYFMRNNTRIQCSINCLGKRHFITEFEGNKLKDGLEQKALNLEQHPIQTGRNTQKLQLPNLQKEHSR